MVDMHVRRHSVEELTQIVAFLLRFGAGPNSGHGYPVAGRTPLMLAAETDIPGLFELLVEHGGDPLKPDARGQNSFQIATAFQSHRVLMWLRRSAR
jgi:ankyrin repeat protein